MRAVVGGKSVSENASVHGFTPLLPAVARAGLGLLSGWELNPDLPCR